MRLNFKKWDGPGTLITFCGLDGCGKTTIINMLNKSLTDSGFETTLTRQPTSFVRESRIFRTYMDEEKHDAFDYRALSLMAASDRVQHSNKYILPLLQKGGTVLSDRYFYSCLANLRARGFTADKWIYEIAGYIPEPDLVFFLDVDVETALLRIRKREDEKDKWIDIDLQYKLREEYLNIRKASGGILIDTSGDPEVSFKRVYKYVESYLEGKYCMKSRVSYG